MKRLVAALALVLGGCARHLAPALPLPGGPTFVELEAGWRVRVITPMLRSGGFLLKKVEQQVVGDTITLSAGDEFLGYETATYAVEARRDGGVRVAVASVDFNRDGAITHPAKSLAPRLRMPPRLRLVRLVYMQKVSDADRNMAVLAATDLKRLHALTLRVVAEPVVACRNSRKEYCEWIPAGIAVRPERSNGAIWVPAR